MATDPESGEIYVGNDYNSTVSVIDGNSDTVKKQIPVGKDPGFILVTRYKPPYSTGEVYVANAGSGTVSVIQPVHGINEQNITVGSQPSEIVSDLRSKLYVSNSNSSTVSVIDVSGSYGVYDKKEPHDIIVGQQPGPIAFNSKTRMIYVGNTKSGTVSVINGYTSKVAAGIRFYVNPVGSGTIMCNNQTYPGNIEYPTNVYMYVDNGTRCTGRGNANFGFDRWTQGSLTIRDSSGKNSTYITVDRYGNFTANFRPLPQTQITIPSDFLYGVVLGPTVGAVLGGILGWYIPYLMNKRSTNKEDANA